MALVLILGALTLAALPGTAGCLPEPAAPGEDDASAGGGGPPPGEGAASPGEDGAGVAAAFSDLMEGPLDDELPGELIIYFLDVGQGDASVIRTPGGRVVLVDTGEEPSGVAGFLREKGVERVEMMLLSHPHADHIGGARAVLDQFEVGTVAEPGYVHTSNLYAELLERIVELRDAGLVAYAAPRAGDLLDVDPSMTAVVLHPDEPLPDEANNASLVVRFVYGSFSVLFTGDCEEEGEEAVLARWDGSDLASTVLKVGHHGSASSTTPAFLAAVAPAVAVIQVGEGNPYGHPSPTVLSRLGAAGAEVYLTSEDGTVIVHSDGQTWEVMTGP